MAGIYFLSNFFTVAMVVNWAESSDRLAGTLSYASIDGLNIGMAKAILGTSGSTPFGLPGGGPQIPAPHFLPVFLIVLAISTLCMMIAWNRVRAVEVVG